MYHYTRVIQGLVNYIDAELISKMAGSWKAWMFGTFAGIAASEADALFKQYKDMPLLAALRLVDGENVNVDRIYGELQKQAQKGNMTVVLPIAGPVTFGASDVDALVRYIKG